MTEELNASTWRHLPIEATHGYVAGIVRHDEVIGGTGESRYATRDIFGSQTGSIDAIHVHRMRSIVQGAESDVTCEYQVENGDCN